MFCTPKENKRMLRRKKQDEYLSTKPVYRFTIPRQTHSLNISVSFRCTELHNPLKLSLTGMM